MSHRIKSFLLFFVLIGVPAILLGQTPADSKDQHRLNNLYIDYIYSTESVVLEHPLPNGKWRVTLNMGDASAAIKGMRVKAEGTSVGADIDSVVGQFCFVDKFGGSETPTFFEVDVADGSMTLEFSSKDEKTWVLNHMSIESMEFSGDPEEPLTKEYRYDFGTQGSPLQAGYERISDTQPGPFTFSTGVRARRRRNFSRSFVDMFLELEFAYSGLRYGDRVFRYRLFEPPHREPGTNYPLVVWLHGKGESGEDNEAHIRWLRPFFFRTKLLQKHPAYVLAVQCSLDDWNWAPSLPNSTAEPPEDMAKICKLIADKTMQDYPIDKERVYLLGISSGGTGAWKMGARFPELFACVIPLSSGGGNNEAISRLTSVPVWAFNNLHDDMQPIDGAQESVKLLNEAGGNAHFTPLEATGHISRPFEEPELEVGDWMFAKRKSDPAWWMPPGSQPSSWTVKAAVTRFWPWLFVPIAMMMCCAWLLRRRMTKSKRRKSCSIPPLKTSDTSLDERGD